VREPEAAPELILKKVVFAMLLVATLYVQIRFSTPSLHRHFMVGVNLTNCRRS
jgi:hypothetical protein